MQISWYWRIQAELRLYFCAAKKFLGLRYVQRRYHRKLEIYKLFTVPRKDVSMADEIGPGCRRIFLKDENRPKLYRSGIWSEGRASFTVPRKDVSMADEIGPGCRRIFLKDETSRHVEGTRPGQTEHLEQSSSRPLTRCRCNAQKISVQLSLCRRLTSRRDILTCFF
jgi:hypothetical protein